MSESKGVGVGLVGCGAIAQLVHLPILSTMKDVHVAAVCDQNLPKAKTVAVRFGVGTAYGAIEEMLEHPDLDALIICTPNYLHASHAEMALEAGLDVLCERPLGLDPQQVAKTLAVAEQARRSLMVANNHRFRPDAWALRSSIAKGDLGEIFHLQASWHLRRARRPRVSEWRRIRERGGGVLMDLGVTNLDLSLWLLDYPAAERLTAYLLDHDDDGVDDAAVILIRLGDKLTCSVDVSWDLAAVDDRHMLMALGSRGFGSLSPFVVHKEAAGRIVNVTPRLAPGTENVYRASYRRELDYFLGVVQGKREEPLPREQVTLLRIVDACFRSAQEGREITL